MRAIALAIILGSDGIERILRKIHGVPIDNEPLYDAFCGFFIIAFVICLIGGW